MANNGASKGNGSEVSLETFRPTFTNVLVVSSKNSLSPQITSFKLNGRNFFHWSRSVEMVIRGKGKICYIDGSIKQPASGDPSYVSWDIQNSIVMAWLIHSMEDHLSEVYLLYPTVKAIWDTINLA